MTPAQSVDVAIIGGSFAGLSAALQLGRASRTAVVIDAGAPRNAVSSAAYGVPGWDGTPPAAILDRIRTDALAYPTIILLHGRAETVRKAPDGRFVVTLADGSVVTAARVILAYGMLDHLPAVPGLAEGWGSYVLHCPYCHGYEVKGQPLAVLARNAMALNMARLLRAGWSDDVTLCLQDAVDIDSGHLADEQKHGIRIERRRITSVRPDAAGGLLSFDQGPEKSVAAVFVASDTGFASPIGTDLGCQTAQGFTGPYLRVGAQGQTTIPGVFAAGDITRPAAVVTAALADGVLAGISAHQSLIWPERFPPLEQVFS